MDRVWVGVRSAIPGAFGGFHHPDQGYRHQQMGSIVTRYGDLCRPAPESPELEALDLLRAYAHDCLHYGSFREYRLWDGRIVRSAYGINCRDRHGATYSAPDPPGAVSTRNLGVVMEGATDYEARALTREVAGRMGLVEPRNVVERFAFRDVTGRLGARDLDRLSHPKSSGFLAAMGSYERRVGARYRAFLADLGGEEAECLHSLILASVISGKAGELSAWLAQRCGRPDAFAALFRAPGYHGPDPSVG